MLRKVKKGIVYFFEVCDIFSVPPAFVFTFKNKFRYSTISTKFMTFVVVILSCAGFIYFSENFIYSKNPQTLLSEEFSLNPEPVLIGGNTFMFSFAMENASNNYVPYIDETIYKPEALLELRIEGYNSKQKIEIGPCGLEDLPSKDKEYSEYFYKNALDKMYCFKNTSNLMMNGTWDSKIFKGLRVKFFPCKNDSNNTSCKSQEIINNYIENNYMLMHYTSAQTILKNYDKPFNYATVDDFRLTSLKLAYQLYLSFGRVRVETDSGIMKESLDVNEGINLVSANLIPYISSKDEFYTFYLRLDPLTKVYKRKYDKILEVLSQIGGLIRVLTIFGAFLLKPFLEEAILQRVSNEIFDYEEIRRNMYQNASPNKIKIKLSIWEFLKTKFKKKRSLSAKSKILINTINRMKTNFDIAGLVNKLFDVEKLKMTASNKDYQIIKLQKPRIVLNDQGLNPQNFQSKKEETFHRLFVIKTEEAIEENIEEKKEMEKQPLAINNMERSYHSLNLIKQNNEKEIEKKNYNSEMAAMDFKINQEMVSKEINHTKNPHFFN